MVKTAILYASGMTKNTKRLAEYIARKVDADTFNLKEMTDDYQHLQLLTREITRQLHDEILITPKVKLVPKGALKASDEAKAVRVKDLRKKF